MTDTLGDLVGATGGEIAQLNAALAAAQGEFPPIPKDKTVKTASYEFSYASLDAIIAALRPALAKNGLSIVQLLEDTGTGPALRTELRHQAGGSVGSSFPLIRLPESPQSPQQLGSLLTYMRRYALTALLGVAAEEDDDAQAAAADTKPAAKPAPKGPKKITQAQVARLWAIAREHSIDEDRVRAYLNFAGFESTADITVDKYDLIVEAMVADKDIPF